MFKLLFFSFLLIIFGGLAYDINLSGSFQKSNTYKFLQDSGAIEYGKIAFKEAKQKFHETFKWAEKNIPVYYNETCTYMKPYVDLTYDLSLVIKNSAQAFTHNFMVYVDKNYPTLQDSVSILISDTMTVAKNGLTLISSHLQNYTESAVQYANNMFS